MYQKDSIRKVFSGKKTISLQFESGCRLFIDRESWSFFAGWIGERPATLQAPQHNRPYPEGTPPEPMKRLLLLALTAATLLIGTTVNACEKHLNGHQNGSDTDLEGSRK